MPQTCEDKQRIPTYVDLWASDRCGLLAVADAVIDSNTELS